MSDDSGPPSKAVRLTSTPSAKADRRFRSYSCVEARRNGAAARLSVFARLPASCPFVGSFHYAPSAGNRAYCFFEGQIVPHRETRRLHKIRTNPLTGNFHSRPGHYSRLHGLQNFRSEFEGLSAADDGGMTAIIARIKTSLTEPSTPAVAEATANDSSSVCPRALLSPGPGSDSSSSSSSAPIPIPGPTRREHFDSRPQLGPRAHTLQGFHSRHSACDALESAAALGPADGAPAKRAAVYSKFWQKVDTERGRFGSSVDDNALGASSLSSLQQSAAAAETAADGRMVAAAVAAGVRGIGKGGVHWGEHHHHHNLHHQHQRSSPGSDDGEGAAKEPLVRNTSAERRHVYLEKQQRERPVAVVAAQRARVQAIVAVHGVGGAAASSAVNVNANSNAGRGSTGRSPVGRGSPVLGGRGKNGSMLTGRGKNGSMLTSRRSMPDAWAAAAAAADPSGGMIGGGPGVGSAGSAGAGAGAAGAGGRMRRATNTGQGWESHTVQAQQKTQEYMQGREDLAPDMRPDVVLDNEVSLAYDVDVSDAGLLGAGAYGTVLAAVHRSTGRQVAIKTMLKKYLFSDAEKASVEREIEIQQRLVNNHVVRLYEIYQSPEKLYLVVERAPCGTLEEFLYVRGRMNELDAKRVVRQLLDGLAYLHKVGVVHCDLKPANILFSDIDQGATATAAADVASGGGGGSKLATPRAKVTAPPTSLSGLVVKICDFGHARKVPDCRYFKFTGDINKIPFHMFKHTGTEGFVAPEVLRSEPYGKAADTWSTGCMLYQMLTGRMPWMPSRACLQRPLSTSGPSWKNVSELAKSLVGDLLAADQSLRADVEQATHHPWFEGIHHCARMPTSAPGGKTSAHMSPRQRRLGSMPAMPLLQLPKIPPLSRDEGVRSGDVAAGGGGAGRRGKRDELGSPEPLLGKDEIKDQEQQKALATDSSPGAVADAAAVRGAGGDALEGPGPARDVSVRVA